MGYFFATLSAFMAAILIIAGKWTLGTISPLALNALIFPLGTVGLGAAMIHRRRWRRILAMDRQAWKWTLAFSLLAFVAIWAYWLGLKMMDPTLASLLNRSETLVTITLGIIILGERFSKGETLGAILALIGIVLMKYTIRGEFTLGFWVVLFSAVCFGTAEFVAKIAIRYIDPLTLSFLRNLINSVLFWFAMALNGADLSGIESVWGGVLIVALTGPIFTRVIYLYALKYAEVSKVAVINQSQPVFVAVLAFLVLRQLPAPREVLGGVLIIGGYLFLLLSRRRATGTPKHPINAS